MELVVPITVELVDALVDRVVAELQATPNRRFLSKPALAQYLGVTERRVKTLREHGLPARKVGRDLYFDIAEGGIHR